jgi:hypothetical protein
VDSGCAGCLAGGAGGFIQGAWGEEGGAFVAVQGAVLTGEKIAATVFAHGRWAGGAIGFGSGHFGEEAFREILKIRSHR